MKNYSNRIIEVIHYDNGSIVCSFLNDINNKVFFTFEMWKELKNYYSGKSLPKIKFEVKQNSKYPPQIDNENIRIIIIDKDHIKNQISVTSQPSHIILLYTKSTEISSINLSSFSFSKLVNSKQEITEICQAVYFDIFHFYLNNLNEEFSGNKNSLFNQLKMSYIKNVLSGTHSSSQRYDSLFMYASGNNLKEKVENGCRIWIDFVKWLKFNKDNYSEPNSSADKSTITTTVNDINNIHNLTNILNHIYKNYKYASQLSHTKLIHQLECNYDYPCYLVRTIKKPKKTAQRKKLAALMSKKHFRCGLIKIVNQRNIFKYYNFEHYVDIFKLQ